MCAYRAQCMLSNKTRIVIEGLISDFMIIGQYTIGLNVNYIPHCFYSFACNCKISSFFVISCIFICGSVSKSRMLAARALLPRGTAGHRLKAVI